MTTETPTTSVQNTIMTFKDRLNEHVRQIHTIVEDKKTGNDRMHRFLRRIRSEVKSRLFDYASKGVSSERAEILRACVERNLVVRSADENGNEDTAALKQRVESMRSIVLEGLSALPKAEEAASMDVDAKNDDTNDDEEDTSVSTSGCLPELCMYFSNLVVWASLQSPSTLKNAQAIALHSVTNFAQHFNRRSMDILNAKMLGYLGVAFERDGRGGDLRNLLLAQYRTACLQHNEFGKVVLLNLLTRSFLNDNEYDRAAALVEKTLPFPDDVSNNQLVRHLYYRGKIQCVRDLKYADAFKMLSQALRKIPQNEFAAPFRLEVQKLAIVVQLLTGNLPERSLFNQPEFKQGQLRAYLALAQCVRVGDLNQFAKVFETYADEFTKDDTRSLVLRLRSNVIKAGLKRISISYSRISFQDIAKKLQLESAADAECVCAKAIRDGVVSAVLDHANGYMRSKELADVYATAEPRKAFHLRTSFCLDIHNEAVKAMRYPPDAFKIKAEDSDDDEENEDEEKKKEEDDENEDAKKKDGEDEGAAAKKKSDADTKKE